MTKAEIAKFADTVREQYLEFHLVENKLSARPDLHAMLLLDRLSPGDSCMLSGLSSLGGDLVIMNVDLDDIMDSLTEELITELVRCGILFIDDELSFYV